MLDIIVVNDHTNMDNIKNDIAPIAAVYNNLNSEQYFVKARMLTDEKIGAPVRQSVFKVVLTNLNDEKFVVSGNDLG